MAEKTTPIDKLIEQFAQVFSQDFMEFNLKTKLGYKLMTEYEVSLFLTFPGFKK